ncbi:MAG: amino acid racemase [Pseudomonadota bacterium]
MPNHQSPMRIGILGGTSHVITSTYYEIINALANERLGGAHIAETIIAGMNFGRIAEDIADDAWDRFADYVADHVDRLEAAGAELIIGTSNTTHQIMGKVMAGRDVPYLPITQPLIAALKTSGISRVALFGTQTTMGGGVVMQEVAQATGIDIIVPSAEERNDIHRVIFDELVNHQFTRSARERYVEIAHRLSRDEGADGLILGCTEIMLLIDQQDIPELPVFATARLHCEAAVAMAFGDLSPASP